jgi:hypothetical protein
MLAQDAVDGTDWTTHGDGSLVSGAEFVHPPWRQLTAGLADVRVLLSRLTSFGFTATERCGLHVHLCRRPFSVTGRDHRLFALDLSCLEPLFLAVLPASRRRSSYAECTAFKPPWANPSHYDGVSYNSLGTFEVRYHHGVTDYEKVEHWVTLLWRIYTIGITAGTVLSQLVDEVLGTVVSRRSISDGWTVMLDSLGNLNREYWMNRLARFAPRRTTVERALRERSDQVLNWRRGLARLTQHFDQAGFVQEYSQRPEAAELLAGRQDDWQNWLKELSERAEERKGQTRLCAESSPV